MFPRKTIEISILMENCEIKYYDILIIIFYVLKGVYKTFLMFFTAKTKIIETFFQLYYDLLPPQLIIQAFSWPHKTDTHFHTYNIIVFIYSPTLLLKHYLNK